MKLILSSLIVSAVAFSVPPGINRRHATTQAAPDVGSCSAYSLMTAAGSTCAGASPCTIKGGGLGVYPGPLAAITGPFAGFDDVDSSNLATCALDGLAAFTYGRGMTGHSIAGELGGKTFGPAVYTSTGAFTIGLANPIVYLDAGGHGNSIFVFNGASTLTTAAGTSIVLLNGAKAENVYWVLGTALTMGADSTLIGTVLAGSAATIGTNGNIIGRAIVQTALTCETACGVGAVATVESTATSSAFNYDSTVGPGW